MNGAPVIGGYEGRMQDVCERAEQLETQGARRQREAAEARAIAGPDAGEPDEILVADGGEPDPERFADMDTPLHVGDQVSVKGRSATTVVMRVCEESAGEYWIGGADETVATYNGCATDEDVYQVVFAGRSDADLQDLDRYPYPRSMLSLEEPLHDRDDGEEVSE